MVKKIRENLIKGKIDINDLEKYKEGLDNLRQVLMSHSVLHDDEFNDLKELIMLYLDYYTYSENGDVLIYDHEYDELMNHYINNGGRQLSKADVLKSQWDFVKHESPGMVGTVKKVYTFEELCVYLNKYRTVKQNRKFRIAPKFDGISSAIKINKNGELLLGVTRNDGIEGQDITEVIRRAENFNEVCDYYAMQAQMKKCEYVWIKTELVMSTENFEKCIEEKLYKNRRSATSGIVNSPKNLQLARFINIIPLAAHYTSTDEVEYSPVDSKVVLIKTPYGLMEEIVHMLSRIRDSSYPFRTDGVVIYPLGDDIVLNYNDIMDNAVAYKVNTAEGLTQVDYGYVSVGRLGYAVPMLHVKPVEVNETTVTDVSLGSFDKFAEMDIHEGEQVLVYSAGDVIPQAKLPEERHYKVNADLLKIKKRCPYCNEKLVRYGGTYKCENPDCPRIKSGKIANFIIKLKAENVSDKTIEDLVQYKLLEDIPDLFDLTIEDIQDLPGYGYDSATIIVDEIEKIKTREISISSLLGALGINGISEKKCRNLCKIMDIKDMLKMNNRMDMIFELVSAENTGKKTAETFTDFIINNKKLIKKLISIMNIVNDVEWRGNVVFTGNRYPELEKRFNELHYEVSNNVNSKTVAVINSSLSNDSTKCKMAKKKGIDIVYIEDIEKVFGGLA